MKSPLPLLVALAALMSSPSLLMSAEAAAPVRVAMVFDDGPVAAQTEQMLAVLARAQAHVTFSYVGKNVVEHPELARAAAKAGHDIANHSYTHPHLPTLTDEGVQKELADTNSALEKAIGYKPVWFWAPFLESNDRVEAAAHAAGLTHFPFKQFHFISTEDWNVAATDAPTIRRRATTDIRDKTVILCHEWRPETLAELPEILAQLKAQGVVFLTFTEMAKLKP